jgi:sulfate transport system substrate-binding protein
MGLRLAGLLTLALVALVGCGSSQGDEPHVLRMIAEAGGEHVYEEVLMPAFQRTRAGRGVELTVSTGSSDELEQALRDGAEADVAALALESETERLDEAGVVHGEWQLDNNYSGLVVLTLVSFAVRPGNPLGIHDWSDLLSPGVSVVAVDPELSGAGRWAYMGAYGSEIERGASPSAAKTFANRLFSRASLEPDGNAATARFADGDGDVLVAYESAVIRARRNGGEVELVIPARPLQVELPLAATAGGGRAARRFVDFAHSPDGQRLYARAGYRPIIGWLRRMYGKRFADPPGLFHIARFGGWPVVEREVFGRG